MRPVAFGLRPLALFYHLYNMDRGTASARSLSSPTASPIAFHGKACSQHCYQLCALLEDAEGQAIYGISHLQVSECSGQFRIWAGNIAALQTVQSASSLDYRLREVPKVSKQVVALLEDLEEALADGTRPLNLLSPCLLLSS